MVLKNCEPELSYILAELFNMCLKEPCFPDWWKVSLVFPLGKGLQLKTTALSVISKSLNNRLVEHLEKWDLFFDFQYGFRSSRSTADILTVICDRIARAFNRFRPTRAVAFHIPKAFYRVCHDGLLHKLKS